MKVVGKGGGATFSGLIFSLGLTLWLVLAADLAENGIVSWEISTIVFIFIGQITILVISIFEISSNKETKKSVYLEKGGYIPVSDPPETPPT